VIACSAPPVTPSVTVPRAQVNKYETVTIRCRDVGADYYIWTLPEGLTAESDNTATNTTGNEWQTPADSIVVTAAAEGFYAVNLFSVVAKNDCGESDPGVGIDGLIRVESCDKEPSDPYITTLSGVIASGTRFSVTANIDTKGSTTYEWSVPQGLTIVSGNGTRTISIEASTIGIYGGSDIKVKISNNCGSLTTAALGTFTVVGRGTLGTDLVGKNGTYTTFKYPMNLGTWMTANSKEGTPTWTTSTGYPENERGSYYNEADAPTACPAGWVLPNSRQVEDLWAYLKGLSSITSENEPWTNPNVAAGYVRQSNGVGSSWGQYLLLRTSLVPADAYARITYPGLAYAVLPVLAADRVNGISVRCIKSACDEAPTIFSISEPSPYIPVGAQDTLIVNARSIGNTTYAWSVPSGVTVVSGATSNTLVIKFNTKITGNWNQLSCVVTNDCGASSISGTGTFEVMDAGSPGDPLRVGDHIYNTYNFPNGMGTWTLDYWHELPATATTFPEQEEGERGYYYWRDNAGLQCPENWALPTNAQSMQVGYFSRLLDPANPARESFWGESAFQGYIVDGIPFGWGTNAAFWSQTGDIAASPSARKYHIYLGTLGTGIVGVKCVKVNE
jgi:hypothetical protein